MTPEINTNVPTPTKETIGFNKVITVLTVLAVLAYEIWRWTIFATTKSTLWLSIPFIICETWLVLQGLFGLVVLWCSGFERPSLSLRNSPVSSNDMPTVDIFIPCYSEPTALVEKTVVAAAQVNYSPAKLRVCLLDDGASKDMELMLHNVSQQYACGFKYIAREKIKGQPHHAKAGNINNALKGSNADFIVIFDADMVCQKDFLDKTLPHFYENAWENNEQIAFVQTPQSFTNIPENDPFGQHYTSFYGPTLKTWDYLGSTPCCGTNVVFRKKALDAIGGMQYGSITEDFLTSMTLSNAGYTSKYVHEILAQGLAPETVTEFFKQRFRWSAGGLQIFFSRNNALFQKNLTRWQTFLYFFCGIQTLSCLPLVYMLFFPIIFSIASLASNNISVGSFQSYQYLIVAFFYIGFSLWALFLAFYKHVGLQMIIRNLQEPVYLLTTNLRAVFATVFNLNLSFKVTNKDDSTDVKSDLHLVLFYIIYWFLAFVSMICLIVRISQKNSDVLAVVLCMFWISFNVFQSYPPLLVFGQSYRQSKKEQQSEAVNKDTVQPQLPQEIV